MQMKEPPAFDWSSPLVLIIAHCAHCAMYSVHCKYQVHNSPYAYSVLFLLYTVHPTVYKVNYAQLWGKECTQIETWK